MVHLLSKVMEPEMAQLVVLDALEWVVLLSEAMHKFGTDIIKTESVVRSFAFYTQCSRREYPDFAALVSFVAICITFWGRVNCSRSHLGQLKFIVHYLDHRLRHFSFGNPKNQCFEVP